MSLRKKGISRLKTYFHFLEKKLKTDVRYLVSGGGVMMIGQLGVTFIALVSSAAFANLITKEAYGTYQYILGTAEFITTFSLIGLGRAAITSVSHGKDGTLDEAFLKSLGFSGLALALGLGVGVYYYIQGDLLFAFGIGIGTACMVITNSSKIYLAFLNGRKLFSVSSGFTVIGLLIPSLVTIIALLLSHDLITIIIVSLSTSAFTNFLLFVWCRRYKRNNDRDPKLTREALHLTSDMIFGRAIAYLDRLLLFQYAGPAVLAEYWVALNVERQFSHLFKSANVIAIPKLSKRPFAELQRTLPRKLLFLYILIIPMLLFYVLIVPYIFKFIFPLYMDAVIYTQVLGLLFLYLPIKILLDTFISHRMHHVLYRITIITMVPKIPATFILVPWLGIWGVIITLFMEQTIHAVLILWYFFHPHKALATHDEEVV